MLFLLIRNGVLVFCLLFLTAQSQAAPLDGWKQTFPKLAGMNIGIKNYQDKKYQQDLARLDLIILGFHRGWNPQNVSNPIRKTVLAIKSLNPKIKIGQYTILNEAYNNPNNPAKLDIYDKLYSNVWWLRNAKGEKVQWTSKYNSWEVNLTHWAPLDKNGMRFPEWIAHRDYSLFFKPVPEFDIWYFDNVMWRSRIKMADWNLDGKDDSGDDERIQVACRLGHSREWETARKLAPNLISMGNADNDLSSPEFSNKLQGVFLEALMGREWAIEAWAGWEKMMARYHAIFANVLPPRIVGFNVWGDPTDYRFFRYAFTSCLMDDGYFSFTDEKKGYSSVPWFDEYNIDLGESIDKPQKKAFENGVYRRIFQNGVVFINPTTKNVIINVPEGYRKFIGKQDKNVNDGKQANSVHLQSKDGIILIRSKI